MIIKKWNGSAWVAEYPEVDVDSIVATGTPSSSTFLRGDGAWATIEDSGNQFVNTTGDTMTGTLEFTTSTTPIKLQQDHFVYRKIDATTEAVTGSGQAYILLCRNAGGNDVNGTITMDRTSGLRHASFVDILISSGSSAGPVGTMRSMSTAGAGKPTYKLVTLTYNSNSYVALSISNPDGYYDTSGMYFTGRIKTTDTSNEFLMLPASSVTSVSDFGTNESHKINGDTIWHAGNDGSGSGLDADTVDNIHASSFLRSDQNDTMTGALSIEAGAPSLTLKDTTDSDDIRIFFKNNSDTVVGEITTTGNRLNIATSFTNGLSIDADKVGIGTTSPAYKLDVNGDARLSGDLLLSNAALSYQGQNGVAVPIPQGGMFATTSSTQTGYLKITLPVSWTSTMLSFFVDVYEYTADESFTIQLAGYNYGATSRWINTTANLVSSSTNREFNVRFGHDGSKCAIYIGESNSSWAYMQVRVRDFLGGYSNATPSHWADGWEVGFTTTLGTITSTQALESVVTDANRFDGLDSSQFLRSDQADTMTGTLTISAAKITDDPLLKLVSTGTGDGDAIIEIEANDSGEAGIIYKNPDNTNSSGWFLGSGDALSESFYLYDRQNSTPRLVVQHDGKVGIGTNTPSRRLHLVNGDFYTPEKSDSVGAAVGYGGNSFQIRNGSTSEDLNFDVYNRTSSSWYTPLIIKNTGNVGIGTTSPASKLDVNGQTTITNSGILLKFNTDRPWQFVNTGSGAGASLNLDSTTNGKTFNIRSSNANELATFHSNDATSTDDNRVWLLPDGGRVGIGTTSPGSPLTVVGTIESLPVSSSEGGDLRLRAATGKSYQYTIDNYNDALRFIRQDDTTGSSGQVRMLIDSTGRVGIGTAAPTQLLDVNGSASIRSNLYLNNNNTATDTYVYFGDAASDTAHWMRFTNASQQFTFSDRVVGTAGRLGAIEYNGSDVDKVNFQLDTSTQTLTITTS